MKITTLINTTGYGRFKVTLKAISHSGDFSTRCIFPKNDYAEYDYHNNSSPEISDEFERLCDAEQWAQSTARRAINRLWRNINVVKIGRKEGLPIEKSVDVLREQLEKS